MAFFDEFALVHFGGRGDPQLDRDVALGAQHLGRSAEVADVGHARADEGLVDLGAGHFAQELGIVRIVGAADNGLFDVGEINLDDRGVLSVFVGFEQFGLGQPGFDFFDAAGQCLGVGIAVGNHVLHEHDVGLEVLLHRLFVELDGAASSRALGRCVRQLKRLLDLEVGQAFDLQDTAREHVLLAGLGHGQETCLDGVQRNGMHQVAQGHARLHLALEAHQHRLGHVQRHHAGGRTKGDQARACREGNADGKAGVRVTAGTHGVGQQQAVEPRVDHAVARAQRHAAAAADELGQFAVGLHIDRLGVGRGMAEGLHHHVGAKAQAGQVFELVAGHGAGGVLRAHGGHARLAVGTGANALPFRQAHSAAHHFLSQGEAGLGGSGLAGQTEQGGRGQAQEVAGLGRQ